MCADSQMKRGDSGSILANIITFSRIILSIVLLFCPVMSPQFYTIYIVAGLSDIFDGYAARKTNSISHFGSVLDTIADTVFVAACLIKLFPVISFPRWLYVWIGAIALIKFINIVSGFVLQKQYLSVHSIMNKITGGLLFLFPLTLSVMEPKYSGAIVCAMATFAAIQEGHLIRTGKVNSKDE